MAKINTEFSFTDNVTSGLGRMRNEVEKTTGGFSKMASTLLSVSSAIQIFREVKNQFDRITASVNQCVSAYQYQSEQELKLETIMKQRMNATEAEIKSIKDFANAQQQIGIYGDEMILQGAQELASFVSQKEAIEVLIPAMNNLIAQQYGYSASGQNFQQTADMMGKVLSGQTGALSRMGYIFSEEEKQLLKTGTEMERASVLAKIITDNVGEMNQALAGTQAGSIQNMTNKMGDLREEIGKTLMPLRQAMNMFKNKVSLDFLSSIQKMLNDIVPKLTRIVNVFSDIYEKIKPIIERIGNFIKERIGTVIEWVKNNINNIIIAVEILAGVVVTKTMVMATAWAVVHWKATLIVTAITAIMTALNQLNVTSEQVCGAIGAVFGGLASIIYNVFVEIYNSVANVLEDIHNIFTLKTKSPLDTIKDAITQNVYKAYPNAQKLMEEEVNADRKFKLLAYKDFTQESYQFGKDLGKTIDDSIAIIQNALKGNQLDTSDVTQAIQDSFNFSSGNLVTSDVNSELHLAQDYIDYLLKSSREKTNLEYGSATPASYDIAFNFGTVNINDGSDFDSFMDKMVGGIREALGSDLALG